ncbi:MAG: histidine kinase, partial [Actinomyces sp.]|nr:histidine kinase [Actinomyces sp.]
MPEWKSFTFGEDGEATLAPEQSAPESAAPTKSAMEPDEYAAKWGTEVSKVTIERISKVLDGDGLPHGSNEFIVATQLNDVPLQIHREPADAPWLQVETRIVPPGEGHTEVSLQE